MKESDSQPNESQEKSGPPKLGGEEVSNLSTVVLHRSDTGGGAGGKGGVVLAAAEPLCWIYISPP